MSLENKLSYPTGISEYLTNLKAVPFDERSSLLIPWSRKLLERNNKRNRERIVLPKNFFEVNQVPVILESEPSKLSLGSFEVEGKIYNLTRNSYKFSVNSSIGSQRPSVQAYVSFRILGTGQDQDDLIGPESGVMSWRWLEGLENPTNGHRELQSKLRGRGLGEQLLSLSEQALRNLEEPCAIARTAKPASAIWFIKQGYGCENVSDYSESNFMDMENFPTDFNREFRLKKSITLKKML